MKLVVRAVVSLGLVAALAMGCGSTITEPESDVRVVPDVPPQDAGQDVSVDVPAELCETNEDCAARNPDIGPCQIAVCRTDGTCGLENMKNYETCEDADECTSLSVCVDGACTALRQADCDDQNPCTADSCLAATGCQNTPSVGALCDDGDPCTDPDQDACDADGVCEGGPYICEPCDTDADCAAFEDANLCNGTLACIEGTCRVDRETVVACDPSGDPACQATRCVPETGACERAAAADGSDCEDGNVCTQGDACQGGACAAGDYVCEPCETAADCTEFAPENLCLGDVQCIESECRIDPASVVVCDPSDDPCAVAYCDAADGTCKTRDAIAGTPCDDEDVCTTTDRCQAGECSGRARTCDDANACTTDSCDEVTGDCIHAARGCDDGDLCTTDACDALTGECENEPIACDDENACTTDACDPATGECTHEGREDCADTDPCTLDGCDATTGECTHDAVVCNDQNLCTTDACDPETGACVYAPVVCNDGLACTNDVCNLQTGECVYTQVVCDDQNACTTDACDTQDGSCDYTPIVCEDEDPCTQNTCDRDTGCAYPAVSCEDGSACTTDACDPASGECTHTDVVCNDDNLCTTDGCHAVNGCTYTPVVCDDGLECTVDSCDPANGSCVYDDTACPRVEFSCTNELDDDGDGDTDCDDSECADDPVCTPPVETDCDDQVDNDGDSATDCEDPDCDQAPECQPGCVDDGYEDNDELATAWALAPGEPVAGAVSVFDDLDFYSLELCGGGTLDVTATFEHALGDIDIFLVDGEELVLADGATFEAPESFSAVIPADGTYYIVVAMYDEGGCNPYELLTAFDDTTCGILREICDDEIDNDGDGAVDCDDDECLDAPNCAGPQTCEPDLTIACGDLVEDSTSGLLSALSTYDCAPLLPETGGERVFAFTPGVTGDVRFLLNTEAADLDFFVLQDDCTTSACVGFGVASGSEDVILPAVAGTTYYLVVDGYQGAAGPYTLSVECLGTTTERDCTNDVDDDGDSATDCDDEDCAAHPACAEPGFCEPVADLVCGQLLQGTNVGGVAAIDAYSCAPYAESGPEVAYSFTAEADGDVTLTLSDLAGADLDLFVLAGECRSSACVAAGVAAGGETVTFAVAAGTTYYVVVDGYAGGESPFTLEVDCLAGAFERICDDGVDNDGDEAVDCDDEDCATAANCLGPQECGVVHQTLGCGAVVDPAHNGTTVDAGNSIDRYACQPLWYEPGPNVAFPFRTDAYSDVTVRVEPVNGADLDVFVTFQACSSDACVAYGDSEATFLATPGLFYYLVVDGYGAADVADDFTLTVECATPAERDCGNGLDDDGDEAVDCADEDCADAPVCNLGGTCDPGPTIFCDDSLPGTTVEGNDAIDFYSCVGWDESGPETAYTFTAESDGPVTFALTGLTEDVDLFVLESACEATACVAYGNELVTFDAVAGTTYYVVVDGYQGAQGAFTLTAGCAGPEPEVCDDQVDNDLDGAVDCADFDCLADPACAVACEVDAFEPNDIPALATELRPAVAQQHSLCPGGDEDWFVLTLPENADFVIETDGVAGDTYLALFAADDLVNPVRLDDDSGNGAFARLAWGGQPAGTYFARVTEYFGAPLPAYTITLSLGLPCEADAVIACADGAVQGSTVDSAAVLDGYPCTAWDESGPEVIYAFTPETSTDVRLSLGDLTVDLDLLVLGGGCSTLNCATAANDEAVFFAEGGVTYYVVVDGYQGVSGSYTLNIACEAPMERVCDDGADNDGDGFADCEDSDCAADPACQFGVCEPEAPVECGVPIVSTTTGLTSVLETYSCVPFALTGPERVYEFVAPLTGTVSVTLDGLDEGQDLDVYVLGDACRTDACVAAGASAGPESFDVEVVEGATYYVVVEGWELSAGAFTLTIECGQVETICDDAVDNDGDGAVDCDDEDCARAPACNAVACDAGAALACGETIEGTTVEGSDLIDVYNCSDWLEDGPEVVYSFTTDVTQEVTFELTNLEVDLDLFVLTDTCTSASCDHVGNSLVRFTAEAGVNYYVVVDGYLGVSGPFSLTTGCAGAPVERACSDASDNDGDGAVDCDDSDCAADPFCVPQVCTPAATLECDGFDERSTIDGPNSLTYYSCLPWTLTGPEYVYEFTTDTAQAVEVVMVPVGVVPPDLDLIVLAGECDATSCLAASSTIDEFERVQFNAEAGVTYYIVVDGFEGAAGDFLLDLVCAGPPIETDCTNELDDDGDTLVDCEDEDCAAFPACIPCTDDDLEDNDDAAGATPVAAEGQAFAAHVCPADEDWFAVPVAAGCTVSALAEFSHAAGDLDMVLRDSAGSALDQSTSIEDAELVEATAVVADTFYVQVYGYQGAANDYDLLVTVDCQEICDDDTDNDGDGDVDCDDADCVDDPACGPAVCQPVRELACGDVLGGGNAGGPSVLATYACFPTFDESGPEVAYSFVAATDDRVMARLSGLSADLDVFILSGACDPAQCLEYGDEAATFDVVAGQTYYVVIDGFNGAVSEYSLEILCASAFIEDCTNGVDDDLDADVDCADADCGDAPACLGLFSCQQPGIISGPGAYSGSTVELADAFDAECQPTTGSEAVWQFEAPADVTVCIDTIGSSFDTVLYATEDCSPLATQIACNDDIDVLAGNLRSQIEVAVAAGTVYTIVVDGYSTAEGEYTLNLRLAPCDSAEVCEETGDEDGDGLADCLDPDCADFPACRCEDAYEPNDVLADATPIAMDSTLDLSICPMDDTDWFTFTTAEVLNVTLETAGPVGDTVLTVYDSAGGVVATNDDIDLGGGNRFSRVQLPELPGGTYYAQVIDYNQDDEIRLYTLSLLSCIGDAAEDDDVPADATPLVAAPPAVEAHSICPAADVDWYVFTTDGLSDVSVETTGAAGDTFVDLYDADLNLIDNDDDSGADLFSLLVIQDLPAGTYYVAVTEFGQDATIDAYVVHLTTTVLACPGNDDAFEQNDTLVTAVNLDAPFGARGVVCSGDDDWFATTVTAGCQVRADLFFVHADGDLDLQLVNANNEALDVSQSGDDNEDVAAIVPADGVYYIRAYGYLGASNRYNLAVAVACPEPEVCDDAVDNDLDGAVDCEDDECALDPACLVDDGFEDNDSFEAAAEGPLQAGGLVAAYGDEDWFWYDVCVDGTVTFDALFTHADGDIDMYLLGPDQAPLGMSNGTDDDESITWTNDTGAARTVYLQLRMFTTGGVNNYDLLVTMECPEVCTDGTDNDGDGLVDCLDEDCVGLPTCPPLPPPIWGQIQWPVDPIVVPPGTGIPAIYGRVYVPGSTEAPGKGFGVRGQLGWGPVGAPPELTGLWQWTEGAFESQLDNDDQFVAYLQGVPVGLWSFAWRFTTDNGLTWLYADLPPGFPYTPDAAGSLDVQGPEICSDAHDNDGDQAVDCDDADCAADPLCVPACQDDNLEENDDFATATPWQGFVFTPVIADGDYDYFSVEACAGAVVTFTAEFDPATDIDIDVYDGAQVNVGASSGFEGIESVEYTSATAQTLYVRVEEFTDAACASYDLTITVDETGCGPAAPNPFFSEYLEGSSNNKALEIVNGWGAGDLDLSTCVVDLYYNGALAATGHVTLSAGTLAEGQVWVVCNSSFVLGDPATLCDQTSSTINFNGDDAVALVCGGVTYDVIGQIGLDPGAAWTGAETNSSTADRTLVRDCGFSGDPDGADAFNPDTQWTGYVQNTITDLGSYNCPAP